MLRVVHQWKCRRASAEVICFFLLRHKLWMVPFCSSFLKLCKTFYKQAYGVSHDPTLFNITIGQLCFAIRGRTSAETEFQTNNILLSINASEHSKFNRDLVPVQLQPSLQERRSRPRSWMSLASITKSNLVYTCEFVSSPSKVQASLNADMGHF